jgi:hypothetical protein
MNPTILAAGIVREVPQITESVAARAKVLAQRETLL